MAKESAQIPLPRKIGMRTIVPEEKNGPVVPTANESISRAKRRSELLPRQIVTPYPKFLYEVLCEYGLDNG